MSEFTDEEKALVHALAYAALNSEYVDMSEKAAKMLEALLRKTKHSVGTREVWE